MRPINMIACVVAFWFLSAVCVTISRQTGAKLSDVAWRFWSDCCRCSKFGELFGERAIRIRNELGCPVHFPRFSVRTLFVLATII